MPSILLIRLVSIVIVVGTIWGITDRTLWISTVFAMGFAHYALALVFSRKQIVQTVATAPSYVPLLSLGVWGGILYFINFPLVWFFALHHAFNEAYLVPRTKEMKTDAARQLRSVGVLLHVFLYLVLLRNEPALQFLPPEFVFAGLAASYFLFFYYLSQLQLGLGKLMEQCGFEFVGLGAIVASFFINFTFLQIVMYHFVFWALLPVPKLWNTDGPKLLRYVSLSVVCVAFFVWLAPLASSPAEILSSGYFQQFTLWSYFHITTAFALSNSHPDWIVRLFRPQSAAIDVTDQSNR